MMGLMVLGALVVYLLVSIWVTKTAVSWAKANNKKPWLWGGLAAFAMYNLVFWDLIPTLVMHKYYCDTQAGFWVYKTPEQWVKENPELTKEDLKAYEDGDEKKHVVLYAGTPHASAITNINSRIYQALSSERINGMSIFPLFKRVEYIADSVSDQKLAKLINFDTGYGNPMTNGGLLGFKGWLHNTGCGDTSEIRASRLEFEKFIYEFTGLGEKND
jgi:hypothetical protein